MSNTELKALDTTDDNREIQPGGIYLTPDLRLMFWEGDNAFGSHLTPDEALALAMKLVERAKVIDERGQVLN